MNEYGSMMNLRTILFPLATAIGVLCLSVHSATATVVRFETSLGNVNVRLYNAATPLNVANFLNYVTSDRYDGTFIHRSIPDFVIQGGGYTYNASNNTAPHIAQFPMVQNEFGISNLRGTIAMAKLPPPEEGGPPNGGPNSATSEWFFNLDNNASNLDGQNGGFTVFGRVVGAGMTVVDSIAALPRYNLGGAFNTVPLRSATAPLNESFVFVTNVSLLNFQAGDYDFNGTVNAADYSVWRSSIGSTTNSAADGNGNGVVDAADYVVWKNTLGLSGGPGAGAGSFEGGVPEPSTVLLLLISGGIAATRRKRK
jgi:peptidyl-prolyl cis-trans isomerase A (cyclophilin A)